MSSPAATPARGHDVRRSRVAASSWSAVRWPSPTWIAPGAIVALAGLLRLVALGRMPNDPFYDAAVRSMGGSWHAFITGAIDPSAAVSVDKPPVDLWFQVVSTKLVGFGTVGLHLPEALGGTLAVLALYDLLHVLFGRRPALAGALALAVLPMAVITSRSDTMDSIMAALVIAAAALTARAARADRPALLLVAGAVLGLAFQVKLFEALIGAPALVLLWWLGSTLSRGRRAAALAGAGVTFTIVGLAWLVALPVLASGHRPWAYGSTNGSAWNATFVYDGIDRLTGVPHDARPQPPRAAAAAATTPAQLARHRRALAQVAARRAQALLQQPAAPSPWRLFTAADKVGRRTGVALGLALLVLAAALVLRIPRSLDRLGRAGWWALGGWLATGVVLFSAQGTLKPRYVEAVDPALAAILGVSVVLVVGRLMAGPRLAERPRARTMVLAAAVGLVLVAPATISVAEVAAHSEDAGAPGALPAARLTALSRYLQAHQGSGRYEAALISVGAAASLIAHDGRPVRVLAANDARPLVTIDELQRDITTGRVRNVVLGAQCSANSPDVFAGCAPIALWVRAHGTDVSLAAGQPHTGSVYAFPGRRLRVRSRGQTGTPTSGP